MGKAEESQLHEDWRRIEWLERTDELAAKRALGPIAAPDITCRDKIRWVEKHLDANPGWTVRQAVDEAMRRWP